MDNCCSDGVQESYKEMFEKVLHYCDEIIKATVGQDMDWTDTVLGTLFVVHILVLTLFFCSRSLITATFRE